MTFWSYVFQDWQTNRGNVKGRCVLVLFRLAQKVREFPIPLRILFAPYLLFYLLVTDVLMSIELSAAARIGPGLQLFHGQALVINRNTVIGANCTLRNSTTIGNKATGDNPDGCPVIGDNVEVGANAVLIGPISIGNNAVIGAGAVVVHDVPSYAIVVGNPARIIRYTSKSNTSPSPQKEQSTQVNQPDQLF